VKKKAKRATKGGKGRGKEKNRERLLGYILHELFTPVQTIKKDRERRNRSRVEGKITSHEGNKKTGEEGEGGVGGKGSKGNVTKVESQAVK